MATVEERFWAKVDRRGPDECWPWTASVKPNGYGQFGFAKGDLRHAHRFAYELTKGSIPGGYEVDHLCHNNDRECPGDASCPHRACVNPAHLEAVDHERNCRRAGERVTHGPRGHAYTAENTYDRRGTRPNGGRECKRCREEARTRRRRRARTS